MFGRRRGYRRGFGRGGGGGLGMMLLAVQLVQLFQFLSNSNEYYPISLGVLGLNLIAYFQPGRNWPSIQQACISVRGAWFDRQWKRIFLAPFYHSHDFHLYYNMASFIWKAISLERHFGSGYFLYMVAIFSVTTNLVYMVINYALAEVLDQWSYINSCAVGFSGVLFALKVVTTHIQPAGMTRVMGFIPVPMRVACWVELVVISVLFPNVSFVGHLAGIIVGFTFVYGPLRVIMDIPLSLITGMMRYLELVNLDGVLSEKYRSVAVVAVGVFMILFPLLPDLVPSGTGTDRHHQQYATEGRSYTYRAGTTGHRDGQTQEQRAQPPSRQATNDTRQYQSYTYASGMSGREAQTENAELQEAIRRSLSEQGEREGGERREEEAHMDSSSEDLQAAIERSPPNAAAPPDSTRPPPYNPNFPTENGPHSDVGWNRDLLEPHENRPDSATRPLGFDVTQSDPNSIPRENRPDSATRSLGFDVTQSDPDSVPIPPSGTVGTEIRQRSREGHTTHESAAAGVERRASSLTRREVREARLLRLGGLSERERKPLSEFSGHSFNFKK